MIIKKYFGGTDCHDYVGSLIDESLTEHGYVGYFSFPELSLYAWEFIPTNSQGAFQNVRSPENYTSHDAAKKAFADWEKTAFAQKSAG